MLSLDRIPGQTGFLIMTEEGAVVASGGELENGEKVASIIMGLLSLTEKIDPVAFPNVKGFKKISVNYEDHCYVICLSNKRIYIVKRNISPQPPLEPEPVMT